MSNDTYLSLLENENKIKLLENFKGAKKHHKMLCLICAHEWVATPISKRQTFKRYGVSGCPNCNTNRKNNRYKIKRNINLEKLKHRGIEILTPGFDGRRHLRNEYVYEKLLVKNIRCGHEFYCSPSNLFTRNVECSVCGPTKRAEPLIRWSKENSKQWRKTATEWQKYKSDVSKLTLKTYQKYKKEINPNNFPRGKAGVNGMYHLDHIVPKRFCFEHNIPPEICAHKDNLQLIGWRENIGSRNTIKGTIPPLFFNYIETDSKLKQYVSKILEVFPTGKCFYSINGVITTLFDEKTNHAVVVIPLDKSQANSKSAFNTMKALQQANVTYTILFEDEFVNEDLLKSKLLHYAKNNYVTKINARQCIIKEINAKEKQLFLDKFHLQGNDNSQIYYGAYYNDNLVAVMTFSKPRMGIGTHKNKDQNTWELVRFATNTDYRIPGIASKLLKHFQRNNEWVEIYSYADRRWSTGNLYQKIGFTLARINPPDYFYIIDGKRKHRWNYRKDILKSTLPDYCSNLTEYQNMQRSGYYRIWDCGTLKYILQNNG